MPKRIVVIGASGT